MIQFVILSNHFICLVLRFGKCIDLLYAAQKSIHHTNVTLRITITLSKLAQALYLYADHIIWLSRSGLTKATDAKTWNDEANKYWFISIVMNLCRDFFEIYRVVDRTMKNDKHFTKQTIDRWLFDTNRNIAQDLSHASIRACGFLYEHRDIFIDTTKNMCDAFIPLTALGYTSLKPRTVGILGIISSFAALYVLIHPSAKLLPA